MGFLEDLNEFRSDMTALADVIRIKTGVSTPLTIKEMISALDNLDLDDPISEVEYIRSSGSQYIDTGVIPTNNTAIEIDFSCGSTTTTQALFGSGQHFSCSLSSSGGGILWDYPSNNAESNVTTDASGRTFSAYELNRYVLKLDKGVVYKDGVECYVFPQSTFTGTYNLGLFCQIRSSVIDYSGMIYMYGCKIWEDGVLIREFVPAKRGNECGLYDRISQTLYVSATTTGFDVV